MPRRAAETAHVEPSDGPAHAPVLAAIHAAAFPPAERWDAAAFAGQLGLPGTFGYLHGDGGMVLARAAAGEAEILTLAVAHPARRLGLGRALLLAALRDAAARGAEEVFLEVAEANAAARGLYASSGFVPVGRRPAYYGYGGTALVMRAATAPAAPSAAAGSPSRPGRPPG